MKVVYPKKRSTITTQKLGHLIGDKVASNRHSSTNPKASFAYWVKEYALVTDKVNTPEKMEDDFWKAIAADTLHNDEYDMAGRAAQKVLADVYGDKTQIVEWVPDRLVIIDGEKVYLTGFACEKCGVNPTVYSDRNGGYWCASKECGADFPPF